MKIINEKGKLFGVINVVDLLVIVFILAVVGGVAWKIFGGQISDAAEAASAARNSTEVTYVVRVAGIRPQIAEDVMAMEYPQQLAINDGLVPDSYITGVTSEASTALSTDGEFAKMVSYDRTDLIFTIKAVVPKGDFIKVGSQEVRVGKAHIVKTQFIEFNGSTEAIECNAEDFK